MDRHDPTGTTPDQASANPDRQPENAGTEGAAAPTPRATWRSQAGAELLAPLKTTFRLAAVAEALVALLELAPLVLLVEAARRMLDGQQPEDLRSLAVVAGILLGVGTVLTAALVAVMHLVDARFTLEVKRRIVAKLARLPLGWFTERNAGTVRSLVVDDTARLHYLVTHAILDLVAALVTPIVVLVYLFVVDARLAAILLIPLIAYGVVFARMMQGSAAKVVEHGRWTERVGAETVAYLEGAAVVRTYGDEGARSLRRTLTDYSTFVNGWQGPLGRRKSLAAMISRPSTFLWVICVAGTALASIDTLNAPTLLTFLVLGVTFGPKLLSAAYGAASYREATMAARRIGLVLAEPELVGADLPAGSGSAPAARLAVAIRDVTFSYRPGHPVLHDIDVDLPAGTVTALVGPSGSGKSTLAALLARFHDVDRGTISVGGCDITTLAPADLYRVLGVVFQDVRLIHGTVAENIALAVPDADPRAIREAAAAAHIADRIDRLPAGYDTVVGTDVTFSGGEAQRIAIARTLLADPPVLVLDEATAFADPESEREVQQALTTLAQDRTVLVIAHRLHTVVDADQIVVLDHGRIVERGTHHDLLATGGRYRELWNATAPVDRQDREAVAR